MRRALLWTAIKKMAAAGAEKLGESRRNKNNMKKKARSVTALATLCLGLGSLAWVGCQKEDPMGAVDQVIADGSAKAEFKVFGMVNNGSNARFNVRKGCHGDEGEIYRPGVPTQTQFRKIAGSSVTQLVVEGNQNGNCVPDDGAVLISGSSAATPFDGPYYYIVPNQGATPSTRQILKLKVAYGGTPANYGGTQFTYNVSTNTWSAQAGASTWFQWTFVTSSDFPQPSCLYEPCGGGNG